MKIAVFGDSYANHIGVAENPDPSWVDILQLKYNIANFALPGSCLYFSYDNFIKNNDKFDKIIFCFTDHARLWLPGYSTVFLNPSVSGRNLQLNSLENYPIDIGNNKKIIDAARLYFSYIYNDETALLFNDLMIEKIKSIRPDGLYFFHNLRNVCYKENDFYNLENKLGKNWYRHYLDLRTCHMTGTNNMNLADHVEKWLNDSSYQITEEKLFKEPREPFEKYFIKK